MLDMLFSVDESQRQLLLLAIARLAVDRPGWDEALGEVAQKLRGVDMFEQFKSYSIPRPAFHASGLLDDIDVSFSAISEFTEHFKKFLCWLERRQGKSTLNWHFSNSFLADGRCHAPSLISAVVIIDNKRFELRVSGEFPDRSNIPPGCVQGLSDALVSETMRTHGPAEVDVAAELADDQPSHALTGEPATSRDVEPREQRAG